MYYKDLSELRKEYGYIMLAIGWLDENHSFTTGNVSKEFFDKLKKIKCKIHTKGYHKCSFCNDWKDDWANKNNAKSSKQYLIDASIYKEKTYYNVPKMITHYIEKHNYKPPQEFINAVLQQNVL